MKKNLLFLLPLLLIVVLGGTFRFWGLGFDLPFVYDSDETRIMEAAVSVADSNLRHQVILFGSLPVYTTGSAIRILSLITPQLKNGFPTLMDSYQQNKTLFFLIGRTISALYGTIEILLLFWLAWIIFGNKVALLSALFFSISPFAIRYAHVIVPDAALSATMLLTIIIAVIAYRKRSILLFLFAGFLAGISTAHKFPGIFSIIFVVSLFFVESMNHKRTVSKIFLYALLIILLCIIAYIISYPYIFWDFHFFVEEWQFLTSAMRHWDRTPYEDFGLIRRIQRSIMWLRLETGTFYFYFSVLGFIFSARRKELLPKILGLFALLFLFVNVLPIKISPSRFVPLIPYISLYSAWALNQLSRYFFIENKRSTFLRTLGLILIVIFISLAPLIKSYFLVDAYASTDTRNLEFDWEIKHDLNNFEVLRNPFGSDEANFTADPASPYYSHQLDRLIHKQTISSLRHYKYAIVNGNFAQWYYCREHDQPELQRVVDVFRYIETQTTKIEEFIPRETNIGEEDLEFLLHANRWVFDQVRGPRISIYNLQ